MIGLVFLCIGLTSAVPLSKIINGEDTTIKDHPHQVSLNYNGNHICGASIIHNKWVLTAAHCVQQKPASGYTVSLNDGNRLGESTPYTILRIIPHPNYQGSTTPNNGAYPNDIALIELNQNIASTEHSAIIIAGDGANFDGQTCTITGWGLTVGDGNTLPNVLQKTTGTILTTSQCVSHWGSTYIKADKHICIHNTATGSCNGDSGGPMVCNNILAGVTSWGYSGCRTDFPSVYARVSTYNGWIKSYVPDI